MASGDHIEVAKDDLWTAWMVLENLAVSLDQIGGTFGVADSTANGTETQRACQEALASYLTPALVQAINEARIRLGKYIPDAEAENLSERIAYWQYGTAAKSPSK